MLRIITFVLAGLFFGFSMPASAQVTQQDESIQQQLVPESFKIEASAIAQKGNWIWTTTITYSITNNSGMNLYIGIMHGGVTLGSCTDAEEIRGALQLLPSPRAVAYALDLQRGPPHGTYVPAGARVSGAILVNDCAAPNPGNPTAPLSVELMAGKSPAFQSMTTFPLSADVPIRQVR